MNHEYQLPCLASVRAPGSLRTTARVLTGLLILSPVVLLLAPWQQSVSGTGKVTSISPGERQQAIDAPVDGRIVRWHVIEGTQVKRGDPIVEIADIDPTLPVRLEAERDAATERIRAARDREIQLEARIQELEGTLQNDLAAADFRIQQAIDRMRAAEQALAAAEAKNLVAERNVERHRAMLPKGLVSTRQLEVAQAEFDTAVAELKRAEALRSEAENFRLTAQAERGRALNSGTALIRDARASRQSARSDVAAATGALQPIEVRLNRQATQTVRAAADGTIFRLVVQPGSHVIKAGDEIASFVPENSRPGVELWVNGNDVPLITPGRHVRLQFEGWPAVQFAGWPSVAVGTFGGTVVLVDQTDGGDGKFRILVTPNENEEWPSNAYLRQGVRTKGWVLLETVPLGFELWRQFNGFPPTVTPETTKPAGGGGKA